MDTYSRYEYWFVGEYGQTPGAIETVFLINEKMH